MKNPRYREIIFFLFVTSLLQQSFAQDSHSFAKPDEAVVTHLSLTATVNFEKKVISGKASWTIENKTGTHEIIFDTRDLTISKVTLGTKETPASFKLGNDADYLGKSLTIHIAPSTKLVNIYYTTSPKAEALQWLSPSQTADKKFPFLFTQSEPILARTWIPCQDGPGIRFTYDATIKVPPQLLAVMSASNPQEKNETGSYHFEMKQPIPSYLMALAVGDIVFQSLSENTGVYAEHSMIQKVAWEFADIPKMVAAAESLYGPYRWERYDVIVLPPSFPFGGMENPRLTFATPTVIAGDRSLVSLVAHELAHSWSGNLVTNATWDDFWLNEGFTNYFERRIDEALYGKDFTDMEWELGMESLKRTLSEMGDTSRDSWLKQDLKGRNADDANSDIAYEKGSFFLHCLEQKAGRENFDNFLKNYFASHAFQSMTTEKFADYLNKNLIAPDSAVFKGFDYKKWIYGPGIPNDCEPVVSVKLTEVDKQVNQWKNGTPADSLQTQNWVTDEWLHFLNGMPDKISFARMAELDQSFHFTQSGNTEILDSWFNIALQNQYTPAYRSMENFLINVGRRKYLTPLYREMMKTEDGKKMALEIYQKARPNYHPVSISAIDEIVDWKDNGVNKPY